MFLFPIQNFLSHPQKVIHPFAFRVHTHGLGQVVSGWKVKNKREWALLGKEDPQLPQMFYPVSDNTTSLTKGETIAARFVPKLILISIGTYAYTASFFVSKVTR